MTQPRLPWHQRSVQGDALSFSDRRARDHAVRLRINAETADGLVMGMAHRTLPLHGVQFHPESIASEHGHLMLKNFLAMAADWNKKTGRAVKAANLAPALMAG